jgi:hypothetical protein
VPKIGLVIKSHPTRLMGVARFGARHPSKPRGATDGRSLSGASSADNVPDMAPLYLSMPHPPRGRGPGASHATHPIIYLRLTTLPYTQRSLLPE